MNALVAGSGSYIVRLSVRDLHGPTITITFWWIGNVRWVSHGGLCHLGRYKPRSANISIFLIKKMERLKRNFSLDLPQNYDSESTDEDTSWTDSSYSNESLIALSTYPPGDGNTTTYKPVGNTHTTSFLDDRSIFGSEANTCNYGTIENNQQKGNRPVHKGLLSRNEKCGANRFDYDYFPPYKDTGPNGMIGNLVSQCSLATSHFSHYFTGKFKRVNSEQTPLLPQRKQYSPQQYNAERSYSTIRKTQPGSFNRNESARRNIQYEEEYQAPPRWKGTDYLEWLGLLRHTEVPDLSSSVSFPHTEELRFFGRHQSVCRKQGEIPQSASLPVIEERHPMENNSLSPQCSNRPLSCLFGMMSKFT